MELIQQHMLPALIQHCHGIRTLIHGRHCPHFRFPEHDFALSVATLDGRLTGIGAPVALEVQLSHIPMLGCTFLCQIIAEEFFRCFHGGLGHAFQVFLPTKVLNIIPGRAAAPVTVAEGQQEPIQVPLLHPVLPPIRQSSRVCA